MAIVFQKKQKIAIHGNPIARIDSKMQKKSKIWAKIRGYRHSHRSFLLTTSCKREIIDVFNRTRHFSYRDKIVVLLVIVRYALFDYGFGFRLDYLLFGNNTSHLTVLSLKPWDHQSIDLIKQHWKLWYVLSNYKMIGCVHNLGTK